MRNAALASGVPAETTAATTLAAAYRSDSGLDIQVTDGSVFLSRGAIRLSTAAGVQAWFTYETLETNLLRYVTPVHTSGTYHLGSVSFDAGATVTQWRDISEDVTGWHRKASLGEGESFWTIELEGINWNSLALFQDAEVLMVAEHYDDIVGIHAPLILFSGWLDQPKVWGDTDRGGWSCSAQGRRKHLKLQNNTPGIIGGELLTGEITASPQLLDLGAEPTEARYTSDFAISNVLDDYSGTLYASLDPPATAQLTGGPTGAVEEVPILFGPTPTSGQGLRITMVYAHPAETGSHVRQEQQFVVVYNNTQEDPPNLPPWDETGRNPLEWGNIDMTKFQLVFGGGRTGGTIETLDGGKWRSVYLGAKNGGPVPPIILRPHTGAVLCYDEQVFRSQFSVPDGYPVVEYKNCDGYLRTDNPFYQHRGAGLGMVMDPDGDWVALRAGPRRTDDNRYSATVASDNGTTITLSAAGYQEPSGGALLQSGTAAWPGDGYLRTTSTNKLVYFSTKDDGTMTLTGLARVNIGGGTANLNPGDACVLMQDTAHWDDFVAFGDILDKIPWDYPRGSANSEETSNQNRGLTGEQPWGVWTNTGTETVASTPISYDQGGGNLKAHQRPGPYSADDWSSVANDPAKAAPVVPLLQAIRRVVMGGGYLQEGAGGNSWFDHDSNSAADWVVMTSPRIGNSAELGSHLFVRYHVAEHDGGTVLLDETETLGRITTQPGEATQWPPALTEQRDAFLRALISGGGIVDFTYTSRTDSTFEGVTKLAGFPGVVIPPDSALTTVINTRPSWHGSGASAFVQRNMPMLAGVSLRRTADLADAELVSHDRGAGTVTVLPGQAAGFPNAGTLVFYRPSYVDPYSPGITITPTDFAGPYIVDYTGRTNTGFTGCTFPDKVWVAPATRVRMTGSTINYPSEMEILVSKQNDPVDPEIYWDNNPSWDVAFRHTFGSQRSAPSLPAGVIDTFFPVSNFGPFGFAQWVYLRVRKTTDDRRLFVNTLRFHRQPRQRQSAAYDAGNADSWAGTYLTSTLVHDLLVDAGVPHQLIAAQGGEGLRTLPIAEGSLWETCRQLALISNCLLAETADGYIVFGRDPRASGAPYRSLPRLAFVPEAIWGAIRAQERPRNVTSQVIYEARNPGAEEHYTIMVPPHPLPYGQVRRVSGKLATSAQGAEMAARLAFRRSNGGWVFSVPTGQIASDLEPGDVIRLQANVDEADRFFSTDCLIVGYDETGTTKNDSLAATVTLEELVIP